MSILYIRVLKIYFNLEAGKSFAIANFTANVLVQTMSTSTHNLLNLLQALVTNNFRS